VRENRRLYAAKLRAVLPLIESNAEDGKPDGGFYLWIRTPIDDGRVRPPPARTYNVWFCRQLSSRAKRTGESRQDHRARRAGGSIGECIEASDA
jgi:hypothetical protein